MGARWSRSGWATSFGFLGVRLDDELLLHRLIDVLAERQGEHPDLEAVADGLQPGRQLAVEGVQVATDVEELTRRGLEGHRVPLTDPVARDGHPLAVDQHVPVAGELGGPGAGGGPPA